VLAWRAADGAFFAFHTLLILFILFGWAGKRLRPWHMAVCLATLFSWCVLGLRYGFGYCPCTDWHWMVRERLGYEDMPRSYIKFLVDALTGLDASPFWVDVATSGLFALAMLCSAALLVKDYRGRKPKGAGIA
jgi:hypothetical protein